MEFTRTKREVMDKEKNFLSQICTIIPLAEMKVKNGMMSMGKPSKAAVKCEAGCVVAHRYCHVKQVKPSSSDKKRFIERCVLGLPMLC